MLADVRRVYYDKALGNKLIEVGFEGFVTPSTIDQDIATYTALSERNRDTFDVLELPFGAYAQDFAECNGYRVNPETKELEFSYPDPNVPLPEPVFQKALSEQISSLEVKTDNAIIELTMLIAMGGMV